MAAKQIIILEQLDAGRWRVAYWLNVQAQRQSFYANPNATSVWSGASTDENAAIASGAVREVVDVYSVVGSPGLAAVEAALQANWANYQAATDAYNPWNRYGSFWDGSSWTAGGVS